MNQLTIDSIVKIALKEDIGSGDITTRLLVPSQKRSRARIFVKEPAIVCGIKFAAKVFKILDPGTHVKMLVKDGQTVCKNSTVLTVEGPARAILTGERTALNFLSYLSGIANRTRTFVDAVRPYNVQILDTRKTTPTLRWMEKYAVRCGGGFNNRDNLSEAVMVKDNHWVGQTSAAMRDKIINIVNNYQSKVIVEVDSLGQLKEILRCQVDIILLDNMSVASVLKAVSMRRSMNSPALFEVSGGVTLKNVRRYAATGIERISIGCLTHSRQAIDFSLEMTE